MLYLIIILLILVIPLMRCIVFNLHYICIYTVKDIFMFFYERAWRKYRYYGIDMYIGMFGHGKTLSMTHKARYIYKRFGGSVRFISNYELKGIPYTPLINFNQLLELAEKPDDKYVGTVVLIDEIENVLNNRNFASFPLSLMHSLTQQRKLHMYCMCSAQRFFMVDKLWRSITTNVYDCNKYWRFQRMKLYDAWDYENGMNPQNVRSLGVRWWFVRDRDFRCYDTTALVSKNMAENFISNEESVVRLGLDAQVNELAVSRPSKKIRRRIKAKK